MVKHLIFSSILKVNNRTGTCWESPNAAHEKYCCWEKGSMGRRYTKRKYQAGHGGTYLYFQHLGGGGMQVPKTSRSSWSTKQVPGQLWPHNENFTQPPGSTFPKRYSKVLQTLLPSKPISVQHCFVSPKLTMFWLHRWVLKGTQVLWLVSVLVFSCGRQRAGLFPTLTVHV